MKIGNKRAIIAFLLCFLMLFNLSITTVSANNELNTEPQEYTDADTVDFEIKEDKESKIITFTPLTEADEEEIKLDIEKKLENQKHNSKLEYRTRRSTERDAKIDYSSYTTKVSVVLQTYSEDPNGFPWDRMFPQGFDMTVSSYEGSTIVEEQTVKVSAPGKIEFPKEMRVYTDTGEKRIFSIRVPKFVDLNPILEQIYAAGNYSDGTKVFTMVADFLHIISTEFKTEWHSSKNSSTYPNLKGTFKPGQGTFEFNLPKEGQSTILRNDNGDQPIIPTDILNLTQAPDSVFKMGIAGVGDVSGRITDAEGSDYFFETEYNKYTGGIFKFYEVKTITLDPNGGTVTPSKLEVGYGKTVTNLPDPVAPEGKTFVKWVKEDGSAFDITEPILTDMTLKAEYKDDVVTPENVLVKFLAGEHGRLEGEGTITVAKGTPFSEVKAKMPKVVAHQGYTFYKWEPALPSDTTPVNENLTFTATYRKNVIPVDPEDPTVPEGYVRIEFKKGEHGELSGETAFNVLKGTSFSEIPVPKVIANKGYQHNGWDPALPAGDAPVNENATYTALYKKSGNGGGTITPPTPKPPVKPDEEIDYERIYGDDRIGTSIELSKRFFDKSDNVIVVRHDLFPDSLTSSVLAKAVEAPILLTPSNKLDPRVATEIERLEAKKVYIVGGEISITPSTAEEIRAITGETERIGGPDRYDTSALVAEKVVSIVGQKGTAVAASGEVYPDALAISSYASANGYPILLVTKNSVPPVITKAISDLNINKTYIVGGPNTISAAVESALPGVEMRLAGADRYATAVEIAKKLHSGAKLGFVASGEVFADALVVGPVAAKSNSPILLTAGKTAPEVTNSYIKSAGFTKLIFVGGPNTISEEVLKILVKK